MFKPRYQKLRRDISLEKSRALIILVALIMGVAGLVSVIDSTTILRRELRANFMSTNPPVAKVVIRGDIDKARNALLNLPEVKEVEARSLVKGRILIGKNEWMPIYTFIVEDFPHLQLARFALEEGAFPQRGEMLVERDGRALMSLKVGWPLTVRYAGTGRKSVGLTGIVHDPGQAPSHMDHRIFGYITKETAGDLGIPLETTTFFVGLKDKTLTRNEIRELMAGYSKQIGGDQFTVISTYVPPTFRHPHQGQLDSLLFLQTAIGSTALFLSTFLIINMFSFLLSRQVKEIGIMKTIGGRVGQIRQLYFMYVVALSLVALAAGVPIGRAMARGFSNYVARELNFNLNNVSIPWEISLLTVALGILVPLLASAPPIIRGTRVTIQSAIMSHGVDQKSLSGVRMAGGRFGVGKFTIALRNTLRHPIRSGITMLVLALGLCALLIGLNTGQSLKKTMQVADSSRPYDYEVLLARPTESDLVKGAMSGLPDGIELELWSGSVASVRHSSGVLGNPFFIISPPMGKGPGLSVMRGSVQLTGDPSGTLAVNQEFLVEEPELDVGSSITLQTGNGELKTSIAGVVREIGAPPKAYLMRLKPVPGSENQIMMIYLRTPENFPLSPTEFVRVLEKRFEEVGIDVRLFSEKAEVLQRIEDHLIVITMFLTGASALVLFVAAAGLVGTLSVSILEQTREIGIMRTLGAKPRQVMIIFAYEALVICCVGWVSGILLSMPSSRLIANFFGELILGAPLDYSSSGTIVLMSALVVFFVGVIVSALIGRGISGLRVKEALKYE